MAAPAALASSLRPDPPAGSTSTALQPDAFGAATESAAAPAPAPAPAAPAQTAQTAPAQTARVLPVRNPEALPLGKPVATAPSEPAAPRISATPAAPAVQVSPIATPSVATAPVTLPAAPAVTTHVRLQRHERRASIPARVSGAVALRPHLPASVRGSVELPWILRPNAAHVVTAAGRRDLQPAALALLGLVVTSGCLLAVAARLRREDVEA